MATPDRLMNRKEVCEVVGLSPSTLYRRIHAKDGPGANFPRPLKIGPRGARWSENAVFAWIERQNNILLAELEARGVKIVHLN